MSVQPLDSHRVIALASGKGGTGKTTLALALAHVLATETGRTVTLADLDPQAALTDYAGESPVPDPITASPVEVYGFTLFRGGRALAHAPSQRVDTHISRMLDHGGTFIGDMAPAWSDVPHRVISAYVDQLFLAARLDAGGLPAISELVEMCRSNEIPFRIIPTFHKRWVLARDVEENLRQSYGDRVTRTVIPDDVRAAESVVAGEPHTAYAPHSRAGDAMRELVQELLDQGDL